jgi:hypothetical protein
VPAYTVNEDAVRHAERLIDARQYALRSRWQNVQPRARQRNAPVRPPTFGRVAVSAESVINLRPKNLMT